MIGISGGDAVVDAAVVVMYSERRRSDGGELGGEAVEVMSMASVVPFLMIGTARDEACCGWGFRKWMLLRGERGEVGEGGMASKDCVWGVYRKAETSRSGWIRGRMRSLFEEVSSGEGRGGGFETELLKLVLVLSNVLDSSGGGVISMSL